MSKTLKQKIDAIGGFVKGSLIDRELVNKTLQEFTEQIISLETLPHGLDWWIKRKDVLALIGEKNEL